MRWTDTGVVIATQKYTDRSIILSLLTENHGRHRGMVRVNQKHNIFQTGNILSVDWSGKLVSNLGHFKCELLSSALQCCLQDQQKTLTVAAITAILAKVLPENERQPKLFHSLIAFIASLKGNDHWQQNYINLELDLLEQTGFALDLSKCVKYHTTENLAFISPKTGKAVSRKAASGYEDKLLPLPDMFLGRGIQSTQEFSLALQVLWYFINKHLLTDVDGAQYRRMLEQCFNATNTFTT